jgi:starch synthase
MMVASEANPYAKTGGLADVVYSLSKELTIQGHEVTIVLPYYQSIVKKINGSLKMIGSFDLYMSWRKQHADLYRTYLDGITYYFIANPYYFNGKTCTVITMTSNGSPFSPWRSAP